MVSHKRFKTDEVKEIAKIKDDLSDWNNIVEMFEKLEDKGAFAATDTTAASAGELSEAELAKMTRNSGMPFSV